jgi:rSAM/selenodomain-associated transferase 1
MCGFGDSWIKNNRPDEDEAEYRSPGIEADTSAGLIIFVKNPQLGKVKTRLAQSIGDEKALEAYLYMLAHTRTVALESGVQCFLFYSEFVDRDDAWPNDHFFKSVQAEGDLGAKIQDAFTRVLATPGIDRAVIIGSDCLDLRVSHVQEAVATLDAHDFVAGPAEDGGYYLLGMKSLLPALFQNKQWSTETVLRDTLADIEAAGATVRLLETLSDVDYEEDLQRALRGQSLE